MKTDPGTRFVRNHSSSEGSETLGGKHFVLVGQVKTSLANF